MSPRALRLAIPKGRLLDQTIAYLVKAGVCTTAQLDPGRRLVMDVPGSEARLGLPLQLLLLKTVDVPTYVAHGVADAGVCGTDVLDEGDAHVLRPYTFPFGGCRLAVAARTDAADVDLARAPMVRIATKYVRTTRALASSRGWNAEIVQLSGSVELGAALGLSDVIVDLVETGGTLKANGLRVLQFVGETEVKLLAAPALAGARRRAAAKLVAALQQTKEDRNDG